MEFRYNLNGIAPANCQAGTATTSLVPITASSTVQFAAIACDAAGRKSSDVTATYTYDNTPPSSTSISIDSAASYATSTSVTLTLAATDASEMYVSNTAGCASGGSWENYATSKGWTLGQSNGTATVYVKYRDAALNESSCIQDTIVHDDTAPSAPTSVVDGTSNDSTSDSPAISWVAAVTLGQASRATRLRSAPVLVRATLQLGQLLAVDRASLV